MSEDTAEVCGSSPLLCRRWRRKPPNRDGWWKFREDGMYEQRILIRGGHVASDDEFEQAMGRPCDDAYSENYWEGNDAREVTFGPLTTGAWMFESEA